MEENNPVIKNILERKSVRHYTSDAVAEETLFTLIRCAMAAPSAKNMKPVEYIVSTNRDELDTMGKQLPYAKMLMKSQQAIIVCGDSDVNPDLWMLDASASTENLLLAAESLELGAVWTALYPYKERMEVVAQLYKLPSNIVPFAVVPIGYPDGNEKSKDKYEVHKIHINKW